MWRAAMVYTDAAFDQAGRLCGWAAWSRSDGKDFRKSGIILNIDRSTTAEAIALSRGLQFAAQRTGLTNSHVLFGVSDCFRAVSIANGQWRSILAEEDELSETVLTLRRRGIVVRCFHVKGHSGQTLGEQVNKWCDLTAKAAMTQARVAAVL